MSLTFAYDLLNPAPRVQERGIGGIGGGGGVGKVSSITQDETRAVYAPPEDEKSKKLGLPFFQYHILYEHDQRSTQEVVEMNGFFSTFQN